jgi:hypothetical protein
MGGRRDRFGDGVIFDGTHGRDFEPTGDYSTAGGLRHASDVGWEAVVHASTRNVTTEPKESPCSALANSP